MLKPSTSNQNPPINQVISREYLHFSPSYLNLVYPTFITLSASLFHIKAEMAEWSFKINWNRTWNNRATNRNGIWNIWNQVVASRLCHRSSTSIIPPAKFYWKYLCIQILLHFVWSATLAFATLVVFKCWDLIFYKNLCGFNGIYKYRDTYCMYGMFTMMKKTRIWADFSWLSQFSNLRVSCEQWLVWCSALVPILICYEKLSSIPSKHFGF